MVQAALVHYVAASDDPEQAIRWSPVDIPENLARNKDAGVLDEVVCDIHDGRQDAELTSGSWDILAKRGCVLLKHSSAVNNLWDEAQLLETYYSELSNLARRLTGADKCRVVSHVMRDKDRVGAAGGIRHPAFFCHGDFSDGLKDQLCDMYSAGSPSIASYQERGLGLDEDEFRAGRLAILNFWRPTTQEPVKRNPLAVCDATTMCAEDMLVFVNRVKLGTLGKHHRMPVPILNTVVRSRRGHKWFYFPEMTRDEVLVFKTFDSSDVQPRNGVGVHSSFEDPATPSDAPSRKSIEARVVCFWAARGRGATGEPGARSTATEEPPRKVMKHG